MQSLLPVASTTAPVGTLYVKDISSHCWEMFENADDPGFAIFAGELRRWVKHLAAENTGVPKVIAAQPSQAEQRQNRTQRT